jgi:hypothetical protein
VASADETAVSGDDEQRRASPAVSAARKPNTAPERSDAAREQRASRVAGPLGFGLLVLFATKLVRAIELSLRIDSHQHWLGLPFTLVDDVFAAAGIGLFALVLSYVRSPRAFKLTAWLLLLPVALLLPADLMAHKLTGAPMTWQRLRGDEGATLADLGLLDTGDLVLGLCGIALLLASVWAALRFLPRVALLRRLAAPRVLLALFAGSGALHAAASWYGPLAGELSDQPVLVMLSSFIEPASLSGLAISDADWRALNRSTSKAVPPKAPKLSDDRPRSAIVFLAEGIDYGHTGFAPRFSGKPRPKDKGPLPDPTPNLVRRFRDHGVVFDRYYANWHASIQAIFSVACSQFPPMQGDIVRIKPRIDCGELSEVVRARGLSAGLFHGGLFSFYDKLALLGRRGYSTELDAAELGKQSKRAKHQWGIDDRAVVEGALRWIDSLPKDKPFFALMIPITAHYPYWTPPDFKKPFKGSNRELQFLNGVAFQDHVLELLARGLEKRGRYDDTLIAWLGDHGHYVGEPKRIQQSLRGFYEPNIHTPLVLLNKKLFSRNLAPAERRNRRLGSHIDLVPTLLDALHLAPDPRHQGQSLLGERFEPRRVFFGADNGRFIGFIDDRYKLAYDTHKRRSEYYDLVTDGDELNDLSKQDPQLVDKLAKEAVRFGRAAQARIDAMPELSEKLSVEQVYDRFVGSAQVSLRSADGKVDTCGVGEGASCAALEAPLRIAAGQVQGERRRCVIVKVPRDREVLLDVTEHDTLELMSGTVVALPQQPKGAGVDPRFRVIVTTDGVKGAATYLTRATAMRPGHPRPRRAIQFAIKQGLAPLPKPVGDAGPPPEPPPAEICLQLTALMAK